MLVSCLEEIQSWMEANYLKLNGTKTECIIFSNQVYSNLFPSWPESFKPFPILATQVKDLGIFFDSRWTLCPQVNEVVSACHFYLRSTFCYIADSDKITMVNALYLGLPACTIYKLQLIQNAAARLLTGVGRRDHITPSLRTLHWLPGCLDHRALHGHGPEYLKEKFVKYVPTRSWRSSNLAILKTLKFKKKTCERRENE